MTKENKCITISGKNDFIQGTANHRSILLYKLFCFHPEKRQFYQKFSTKPDNGFFPWWFLLCWPILDYTYICVWSALIKWAWNRYLSSQTVLHKLHFQGFRPNEVLCAKYRELYLWSWFHTESSPCCCWNCWRCPGHRQRENYWGFQCGVAFVVRLLTGDRQVFGQYYETPEFASIRIFSRRNRR